MTSGRAERNRTCRDTSTPAPTVANRWRWCRSSATTRSPSAPPATDGFARCTPPLASCSKGPASTATTAEPPTAPRARPAPAPPRAVARRPTALARRMPRRGRQKVPAPRAPRTPRAPTRRREMRRRPPLGAARGAAPRRRPVRPPLPDQFTRRLWTTRTAGSRVLSVGACRDGPRRFSLSCAARRAGTASCSRPDWPLLPSPWVSKPRVHQIHQPRP